MNLVDRTVVGTTVGCGPEGKGGRETVVCSEGLPSYSLLRRNPLSMILFSDYSIKEWEGSLGSLMCLMERSEGLRPGRQVGSE